MNNQEQVNEETTIDLGELFSALLDKIMIIILAGVTLACVAFLGTKIFVTPTYDSTTKIYVVNSQSEGAITYSDVQLGSQLTKDYMELVKSRPVVEGVIADLKLKSSYEELCNKISVSNPSDTRMLAITVSDRNPKMAQKIADQLRMGTAKQIQEVMKVAQVTVVEEANLPERAARPNAFKNFVMGGVLGVVLACGIVILIFVLDDRIKSQKDIEKYLKLGILGTIPVVDEKTKRKSMKKGQKKRK